MGGCCCCSSKGTELNSTPAYYYCPRASEEHEPLSSHHGVASTLSTGLLVDTNLGTLLPDPYRTLPAPTPYDVDLGHPQTPAAEERSVNKNDAAVLTTNSGSLGVAAVGDTLETLGKCEDLSPSDCKLFAQSELTPPKETEFELSKSGDSIVSSMDEDVCPTCLEEYDAENPKIITKCEHHFHLACILEWMERSDTCPVCDKKMILNTATNF